jgi:hypothetical protein
MRDYDVSVCINRCRIRVHRLVSLGAPWFWTCFWWPHLLNWYHRRCCCQSFLQVFFKKLSRWTVVYLWFSQRLPRHLLLWALIRLSKRHEPVRNWKRSDVYRWVLFYATGCWIVQRFLINLNQLLLHLCFNVLWLIWRIRVVIGLLRYLLMIAKHHPFSHPSPGLIELSLDHL